MGIAHEHKEVYGSSLPRSGIQDGWPTYTLDGQHLPNENIQMDLGVLIDSQLKFHDHNRNVTRMASGVAQSFLKGTVGM